MLSYKTVEPNTLELLKKLIKEEMFSDIEWEDMKCFILNKVALLSQ